MNLLPEGWDIPPDVIQLGILVAKMYIWKNRCLQRGVTLAEWVKEWGKSVEESEAKITTRINKKELHNLRWGPL